MDATTATTQVFMSGSFDIDQSRIVSVTNGIGITVGPGGVCRIGSGVAISQRPRGQWSGCQSPRWWCMRGHRRGR